MAFYTVKPWYKKQPTPIYDIYGAEQDGTSRSDQTRTDNAIGLADPNPYYAGMSDTPSSPFDNISPQKDIRVVEDSNAGTLVEIPKFYYKQTRTGSAMKLQISIYQFPGSYISPAHMDRDDGVGERDYVYIGKYHCGSNYKSATGVVPLTNITMNQFRTNIHNLGNNIQQQDLAMFQTIRMLYLVEFADQNSQAKIGFCVGDGYGTSLGTMGYTNSMSYHTGTTKTNRSDRGFGAQYRYIEGLQDNVTNQIDGVYFNGTDIYCIKNPANFSNDTGGTLVGTKYVFESSVLPTEQTNPSAPSFEYAIFPSNGTDVTDMNTYTCDSYVATNTTGKALQCGGTCIFAGTAAGLFQMNSNMSNTGTNQYQGSRLMVLPPSRLSPPQN